MDGRTRPGAGRRDERAGGPGSSARACPRVVVHVHACPSALTPHVDWAVSAGLGRDVRLPWRPQPAAPGSLRAEGSWRTRAGTASRLVEALRGWSLLRFEVTEEPSPGVDGLRFSHVPHLGLFTASTSANGDVVLAEDRVRRLLAEAGGRAELAAALERDLGRPWDEDLEAYRHAAEPEPLRASG